MITALAMDIVSQPIQNDILHNDGPNGHLGLANNDTNAAWQDLVDRT